MCESFYVILNIYVYLALYMAGFRYFTQGSSVGMVSHILVFIPQYAFKRFNAFV